MLPGAVREACARQGIAYNTFSDDWVLELSKGKIKKWIFGYKFDINSAAAGQLAQDKVGTYEVLAANKLPVVRHRLVRSVANQALDNASLELLFPGGDVVIKPLSGTGGRGVQRYQTVTEATDYIKNSTEPAWAISPYIDIMSETRLIVLDGVVQLAYEKQQPQVVNGLKFYNLSHGATATTLNEVPDNLKSIALRTCEALCLRLAAVDIIRTAGGEQLVLEVNDGFSMEYYTLQSFENKNRAVALYDEVVSAMFA
jgi:glutathione synthase/RimK-type ligase-like ATP-grasp enzyme